MQASISGMLASRLASNALAACSRMAGSGGWMGASWAPCRMASAAASPDGDAQEQQAVPTLTPEQRQQLPKLIAMARRPMGAASRLGSLAALSISYRDLSVVMSALHARQAGLDPLDAADTNDQRYAMQQATSNTSNNGAASVPLSAASTAAGSSAAADAATSAASSSSAPPPLGSYLPLIDVTEESDLLAVDGITPAPEEPVLDMRFMDKIGCWAATQPPHLETSTPLMSGVSLFPPTEAAYPTYVDFDAAMRLLAHHTSRKRLRLGRKLLRRQDKYQLKTWEHHSGEV